MIRQGDWKLIYYHVMEPQLFNLAEDPGELVDRAQDPTCRAVRDDLAARLLDDWHPEIIASKMAALRADNRILRAWAQQTHPPDQYRWELRPEMNFLDNMEEAQ